MGFFKIEKEKKIQSKELTCKDCTLYSGFGNPKLNIIGRGKKRVMFISSLDNNEELLNKKCKNIGLNVHEDCWKINAVNCFSSKTGPTVKQIKCCEHKWREAVKELKPKKIILLGKVPIETFLSSKTNNIGGINKWAGFKIPDQEHGCWVYPTFNPSNIKMKPDDKVLYNRFVAELEAAYTHNEPFPDNTVNVKTYDSIEGGITALETIIADKPTLLSFDYETSGLKPHKSTHFIKSISFSYKENEAVAILLNDDWRVKGLVKEILTNPKIKKTAHNMKFEETWTRTKLDYKVKNWHWDSMIASHILDNRGGISSLKFQTYINFGVLGYEEEVKPFLEGRAEGEDEKSANALNRIDEAPIDKLLYYNALDALYGYKLTIKQEEEINNEPRLKKAYKLFHKSIISYMDIEEAGWLIDEEHYEKMLHHLKRLDKRAVKKIFESNENYWWKHEKGEDINYRSTDQLRELFFNLMKYKVKKKTAKGRASVDAEVLKQLSDKSEIANALLETRKNKGVKDKIKGFQREAVNGVIHPSYNLHIARSYRSSCNNPNMQNASKRDLVSKRMIRKGIVPADGHQILSRDFSGVEVSTGCFYHKDPVMIDYVTDSKSDMHRDEAMNLFLLDEDQVTKTIRYIAKNGFVFPQFYGDWWDSCAENMWDMLQKERLKDGELLLDHLKGEEVKNLNDFKELVKDEEYSFWNNKFNTYKQWKEEHWEKYQENGYVDFLTGFRCTDVLSKNEAINRPVQGTAFHLLLWSQIEIHKAIKDWETCIIGQIHDDLIFDVEPSELDALIKLTDEIETVKIRKHWKWINVPLGVESEISKINGNWYEMEEL